MSQVIEKWTFRQGGVFIIPLNAIGVPYHTGLLPINVYHIAPVAMTTRASRGA